MSTEFHPDGLNIELTNCCPLHCPQCYCPLDGGKNIPFETAVKRLEEASALGVTHVELSGGETLCYSHLYELIAVARAHNIAPSISISGWGFNEYVLDKLIASGIDTICVSLNGPTEASNKLTRDGYDLAINALNILKKKKFENTMINWVMHRSSVHLLPEMIALAEKYAVYAILIIDPKPTAEGKFDSYPTAEQMYYVADMVKHQKSGVELIVQHCFSSLLALYSENRLWGNSNRDIYKGCTAGLCSYSINVDGNFTPCRHLENEEEIWPSAKEYWEKSPLLLKLRSLENEKEEPCKSCRLNKYCRHCVAFNIQINKEPYIGNQFCPLKENCV